MKNACNPVSLSDDMNFSVSIPMPETVWWNLFPSCETLKTREKEWDSYRQIQSLYREVYSNVDGTLEDLFGKDWYLFHFGDRIVLFVGKVIFRFKKKSLTTFKHQFSPHNALIIDEESYNVDEQTYCVVSFTCISFCRRNPLQDTPEEDEYYWKRKVWGYINMHNKS